LLFIYFYDENQLKKYFRLFFIIKILPKKRGILMNENQKLEAFKTRLQTALGYFNLSPIQEPNWKTLTARTLYYFAKRKDTLQKYWEQAVLSISDQSPWQTSLGTPDFKQALEDSTNYLWEELRKLRRSSKKH
jgi:hypothetical protein